VQVKTASEIT